MPPTYATQVPHAPATLAVGAGLVLGSGGWLPVLYGVDVIIEIQNGGAAPTGPAVAVVEVATSSGGANARVLARFPQANFTAGDVDRWLVGLNPGAGDGGNWPYYRVSFLSPTGQDVTAGATASAISSP